MSTTFFGAPKQQVKQALAPKPAPLPQPDTNTPAPNGPPVPALTNIFDWHGGIGDFNQRLQQVVDQHVQQFGYKPKPADALQAAVLPPSQAENLFAPAPPLIQQSLAAHPVLTDAQFVKQMRQQAQGPGWDGFLQQNGDRVQQLAGEKQWQAQVHGIVFQQQVKAGTEARARASGLSPEQAQMAAAHKQAADILGLSQAGALARPAGQIINSLVHAPGGLYALGKSAVAPGTHPSWSQVGQEWVNFLHSGHLDTNEPLARNVIGIGKSIAEDVKHPKERSGYLFMDLLGFGSLLGGGIARAGEAARTGDATALLRKPPLKRATIDLGGYTEEMPLSSNPLVAYAQQKVLGYRQTKANERFENGPSPLRSVMLPDWAEKQLSFERKVGRETDARMRVEHEANMALTGELQHAAGTALAQSRVLGRLPVTVKNGLTRGEQKAIQVLSWDDPNPIAAERAFHERMIEAGIGDRRAHEGQLADLTLAEKALANPRPRFEKALALTRDVIAEQQRMKIQDLGLAPETAEGRIVRAADVLRGENGRPGEGEAPEFGGFYLPTQPRGKVKRPPSQARGRFSISAGPYGIPLGRDLPELTHEFTGDALRAGDYRIDATNLATEAYARTVRAVTIRNHHKKLWNAATKESRNPAYDIPIRDVNTIPEPLKALYAKMDEGDFSQAEAEMLPKDARDILDALYPDKDKLSGIPIDHVRWIDSRLLGDSLGQPHIPGLGAKTAQAINTPFRFGALYLRPAYALNKLGNAAMLIFDQGFLNSGENLARAMTLERRYGERNAATIRRLTGSGRSRSYVTSSSGRVSNWVANLWNRFADRDERAASFLYYADRKGYRTSEQMDKLLNDEAHRGDLTEVTRRANKALVEFDNLLPVEKNYLRHAIFVYPWVRGSAVWSLRAVMEHPMKVNILSHLGDQELQNDPILSHAPAWFKRIGYFPVGWNHDGTPRIVNPTSINTFSTLSDLFNIGKAGIRGDKYSSVSDLFGPAAQFATHLATGRDEYGNQYPGGAFQGAAKEVLMGLPQLNKLRPRKNQPLSKFDIRRRDSLEASLNSAIHQTVFSPGWLDGFGSLVAGGLSPKSLNLPALAARYWADQDPKVKTARELRLLNLALAAQGKFLGKPVPATVRDTVKKHAQITEAYAQFAKDHGRTPTDAERVAIQKKFYPTDEAQKKAATELRQWDSDVRLLYSFQKPTFNEKTASLFKQGLSPQAKYNVPQEKLNEYGRKYVQWTHEVKAARDKGATAADLRLMTDEHSQPVDGLPSFAAISWANQTPAEQRHALNVDLGSGWSTLTSVEKQLLGKPVDPRVTEAWNEYTRLSNELVQKMPPGQRRLAKNQRDYLVKYVDRGLGLGGKFLSDYTFSKQPLFVRVQYLDAYTKSANKDGWSDLLHRAKYFYDAVQAKKTTASAASDVWAGYVPEIEQHYKTEFPGFWKELQPILNADPGFLNQLIH